MSRTALEIGKFLSDAINIRHELHSHPELGYLETRTSELVQRELAGAGIEFVAGLAGGTGILGRIPATGTKAATIALRADMDALPIHEETGLPYQSQNPGVMHACGHDGHTSVLIATAKALSSAPERPNEVLLLFQPAEEGGAGGKKMCDEGVLAGRVLGAPADVIFGMHGHPGNLLGHVSTRPGVLMAAAVALQITVTGRGCHAAQPHRGIDPIVVAAHIVTALQTIASRNVDPTDSVVVTIGKIEAGNAHNVIPESAKLLGTVRSLNDEVARLARERVETISHSVAQAFGATAEVEWLGTPYPATSNDPWATERFRAVAEAALGNERVHQEPHPMMGGEDFSFYGKEIPACFFFLGLRPAEAESYPNLHSPTFNFNDDAIGAGIQMMSQLALQHL